MSCTCWTGGDEFDREGFWRELHGTRGPFDARPYREKLIPRRRNSSRALRRGDANDVCGSRAETKADGNPGVCRLCREEAALRNSHVLSE